MAADQSPKAPGRSRPEHFLHCVECGRTVEKTREELLRHAREGWPRCCDQTMGYFTLADRPGASDTALERPALGAAGDTAIDGPSLPPG